MKQKWLQQRLQRQLPTCLQSFVGDVLTEATEPLEKEMPLVESVVQEELMVEIPKMIGVMEFVKKENDVALEKGG